MPEQLGNAAIYFDPKSTDEIANTMRILWTDDELCHELRDKGLERSARWTQPDFTRELWSILNSYAETLRLK